MRSGEEGSLSNDRQGIAALDDDEPLRKLRSSHRHSTWNTQGTTLPFTAFYSIDCFFSLLLRRWNFRLKREHPYSFFTGRHLLPIPATTRPPLVDVSKSICHWETRCSRGIKTFIFSYRTASTYNCCACISKSRRWKQTAR